MFTAGWRGLPPSFNRAVGDEKGPVVVIHFGEHLEPQEQVIVGQSTAQAPVSMDPKEHIGERPRYVGELEPFLKAEVSLSVIMEDDLGTGFNAVTGKEGRKQKADLLIGNYGNGTVRGHKSGITP